MPLTDVTPYGRRDWPRRALGSLALLHDHQERLVLVEPAYGPTTAAAWTPGRRTERAGAGGDDRPLKLVGGAIEAGEDPRHALTREVWEELGLPRAVTAEDLLVCEYVPAQPERGKPDGLNLLWRLDPVAPQEWHRIRLPPEELRGVHAVPLDQLDRRTAPALARRIRAAHTALSSGVPVFLPPPPPDGHPPGRHGAEARR
ncbi:NUDIX hydrolase [Streptomyces sp. B1866]|uniref:NUDIX hydrolase n=1 Tax=Streptomyces sp. B1866 TaxID=3075431 RepID=UPI00288D1221|nr:NUDIX hydrolase [Streptomyces sp. B1866]MDT3395305.1 NUDIX hydrolase [Streptomyces sp. B1866]